MSLNKQKTTMNAATTWRMPLSIFRLANLRPGTRRSFNTQLGVVYDRASSIYANAADAGADEWRPHHSLWNLSSRPFTLLLLFLMLCRPISRVFRFLLLAKRSVTDGDERNTSTTRVYHTRRTGSSATTRYSHVALVRPGQCPHSVSTPHKSSVRRPTATLPSLSCHENFRTRRLYTYAFDYVNIFMFWLSLTVKLFKGIDEAAPLILLCNIWSNYSRTAWARQPAISNLCWLDIRAIWNSSFILQKSFTDHWLELNLVADRLEILLTRSHIETTKGKYLA